jgi:SAM-dependent methyltransferase
MRIARLGIRTRLRESAGAMADMRHRPRLRKLAGGKPGDYGDYLLEQQRRTLSKRANDPGAGARELVDRVIALGRLGAASSVLCVGCRNTIELDLFGAAGVGEVLGIDLVSQRPDILVMDMHDLRFDDDRFDAVYASHSLEHAYDPAAVLREIARVARTGAVVGVEVPLGKGSSSADRVEFESLGDLRAAVDTVAAKELWAEEQPPRTPTNSQGTSIARIVFRVEGDA